MIKRRVTIESGELQGIFGYDPRITVFKGVPYAKPPVGELRWRAPQPVEPWEGVRLAAEYGPMSVQNVPGLDPNEFWTKELHPAGPEFEMSEDCLYLNIFTPAKNDDEKLPVLFYIHGGGYQGGYPYEIEFDWEHMARKGIVVVTVQYRLGLLGFLAHPMLSAEHPEEPKGNYGLLDQAAAIAWTKRNIAAFGGDPEKITIAGQSAGAGSVQAQLSSSYNRGLISGAIIQSGITASLKEDPDPWSPVPLSEAEEIGEAFFNNAGIHSLEEARAIPAKEIHALFGRVMPRGMYFRPVIDGRFLTETSYSALVHDRWGDLPVLAGFNKGEARGFNRHMTGFPETIAALDIYADKYGDCKPEFLNAAACSSDEDVKALFASDAFLFFALSLRISALQRARLGHKTYTYLFDCEIPGDDRGSFHGAELAFAYDALARTWRPFTGKSYDMARIISSYWVNFVKTGDPNGLSVFGEKLPAWTPYSEESPAEMHFTDKAETVEAVPDKMTVFRLEHSL